MSAIDFIHDTRFEDLPDEIVHEALRCFIDTLGVAVGGSQTELSRIIHNHAASQFGGNQSKLWLDGRSVSATGAALANGMTIDSVDAHDGNKLCKGHIGCGVIPGLIALLQANEIYDAHELITSIVIGYEIGTRAGISLHASACDYHTSGAWVALATAAVGSRILGLSKEATREAIGIAEYHGPRSQMMRCIDAPTMVKDGSGWGSMAGISAAYLAKDGFTGAPAVTMEDEELAGYWSDLNKNWYITQQYIKLYPVCRWAQPAVEAGLALLKTYGFKPEEIEEIEVVTFHEAKRLSSIPVNTEQAQYSLPFSLAAAIVRGTIGMAEITSDALNDHQILDIANRVEISEADEFNEAFPAQRFAVVTVHLKDGQEFKSDVTEARGDPENKISDNVLFEKFHQLTNPVLSKQWSETFLEQSLGLPKSKSAENLLALLTDRPSVS